MADFVKFGEGAKKISSLLAGNCDRASAADFLILQQQAIQDQRTKDRDAEKNKPAASAAASGRPGVPVSDPAVTGRASGAMARMKAMLGSKR